MVRLLVCTFAGPPANEQQRTTGVLASIIQASRGDAIMTLRGSTTYPLKCNTIAIQLLQVGQ